MGEDFVCPSETFPTDVPLAAFITEFCTLVAFATVPEIGLTLVILGGITAKVNMSGVPFAEDCPS